MCEGENVFDKGDAWMVALLEDLWILLREGEERKNLVHMKQLKQDVSFFIFLFCYFFGLKYQTLDMGFAIMGTIISLLWG